MNRYILSGCLLLAGISLTFARPQQNLEGTEENPLPPRNSAESDTEFRTQVGSDVDAGKAQNKHEELINLLLDTRKWKTMLAEGKVREMVDTIQRALAARRPVRVRTEWGGPQHPNLGRAVRNTINWNAYRSDTGKKSLDIIMDSKFNKREGRVNVVDPSIGFSFQMKY